MSFTCIDAIEAQSISTTTSRTRSKRRSLETIACHYRLWQHIHMCRKAAPQREVWRQLRVITDWGRKVESPCQVQNCVANPEASRLAPFTAPMGSVWVTSPMEHFQCQFVTKAWTQQIPLSMTSSGELGEAKALANEDVVAQSSIHCHSQISSINSNARAGLGCSEAPLSMRMLSKKVPLSIALHSQQPGMQ